jgi:TRAP transporter T-component
MAQPSLNMESDYEMAARAIPGALKTIEGFYIADESPILRGILTEGYCQYATAFVEDEWEVAKFAKKIDDIEYHNLRASKMYARCMNYAFVDLPSGTQKDLFGAPDAVKKRIASIGSKERTPFMWAIVGLGGMINHNLTRVEALSMLPTVKDGLERIVAIDKAQRGDIDGTKKVPCESGCTVRLALPHLALGLVYSAASTQFGGDPKRASDEFNIALRITADKDHPEGKMLLARTLWAYRVGLQTNDRKLFHDQLVKVLETDPAIWPEQRLANEVAQRRARRYLSHEKELFQ